MQVKKFEAPTIQEALENVKRELGPEAIILQTKNNRSGFGLLSKGSVEITAAVSDRSLHRKKKVETRLPESSKTVMNKLPAERQANIYDKYTERTMAKAEQTTERVEVSQTGKKITATRYIDIPDQSLGNGKAGEVKPKKPEVDVKAEVARSTKSFEEEIRYLKTMIEEMKKGKVESREAYENPLQHTMLDVPSIQDAYEQLVLNGVERRYVIGLIKKVAFELGPDRSKSREYVMDLLANEIMDSVEVISPISAVGRSGNPQMIALVGPTGSGKTATIAKLASEAASKRNLKVGLINLDSNNLNTFEQLGTYAKIINVPFRSATSGDDLKAALLDFRNLDVVMIDTTGCSQKDVKSLKEIQDHLALIPEIRSYLVLPATSKDIELYNAASRFSVFHPHGLIISKLDEATIFGSIYNLCQKTKIPLASFTTGQLIPDDIEDASKERLASLLMEIE